MEQLGLQKDLAVGDGDHVGGDVGGNVARLGLDDGQRRNGAAAIGLVHPGGPFQKAAVQVEHVAGVRLASRGTADQQGQGAVGHRVLAQVVVDDQHVLALIHEVFRHGAAGIGRDVLQGGLFAGRGGYHDGVVHSAARGQGVHHLGHGGAFLADGHINADHVLALLVQDGVQRNHGLTGLTVADDEFALAPADGDHAVDGLDAGLQRNGHALALDDARGVALDGIILAGLHRALAVDGMAQRVDHAADELFAHGHGHHGAGTLHHVALADALIAAQHDDRHGVFLQIQRHAVLAVGEAQQLVGHALVQPGGPGDAVADHDDGAGIRLRDLIFVMLDLLFDELGNFLGF